MGMAAIKTKIMATPRKKAEETPPATTPMAGVTAYGGGDHSFTLQAIMDLKGSMGELKAAVDQLKTSIDGTKTKVDDLVSWKNKILGGVFVLGVVMSIAAFFIGKFSDYVTIKSPSVIQAQSDVVQPSPASVPPPSKNLHTPKN